MKKTNSNVNENTILAFHIGRGGRFNSPGHITFLGEHSIGDYLDDLNSPVIIKDGEMTDDSAPDAEWTDCNGRSVGLTNADIESGIGRIDEDGEYDTTYTMHLKDIEQETPEWDAIFAETYYEDIKAYLVDTNADSDAVMAYMDEDEDDEYSTLEDVADYINSDEYDEIELERILLVHGWIVGLTDDVFGCDGKDKIVMRENGNAAVVPLDFDNDSDMELALAVAVNYISDEQIVHLTSREDIEGEEAELIRFTYSKYDESCVAVRYNDGTIFFPYDWHTAIWDSEGWTIGDTKWVDVRGMEAINFNGMPRMLF